MFKGKLKTYLLVSLVFAIWAVISYQIYSAFIPKDDPVRKGSISSNYTPNRVKIKDTFSILNNYRDPFLGTLKETEKPIRKINTIPHKKESIEFPNIIYKGLVSDIVGKQQIFALSIDGREILLKSGSEFNEVQVLSGNTIQINISFKGKRHTIGKL
tara:strand:- start:100 stop:570 length:471 start_codon:yes stop_codon:yes gene_type:complete